MVGRHDGRLPSLAYGRCLDPQAPPSVRYWTDSVNVHHFFGANIIYSHYNVGGIKFPFGLYKSVRDERRQGNLVALGITSFDRFECVHCGQLLGHEKKLFAMPQAALNIVFNIPGRPATLRKAEEPVVVVPPPTTATEEAQPEPFEPVVRLVPDFTGRAGQLQKDNPVLAHISQYKPYDRTRIMRRDKDALYVHFPLAKSVLHTEHQHPCRWCLYHSRRQWPHPKENCNQVKRYDTQKHIHI